MPAGLEIKEGPYGRGVFATRHFDEGEAVEYCPTLELPGDQVVGRLGDYVFGSNESEDEVLLLLGFEMPVAQLRWWLLGIPEPGTGEASPPANGSPEPLPDFEQDGWRVAVSSRASALGFSLPQRLTIEREGARMKLLVDRWNP